VYGVDGTHRDQVVACEQGGRRVRMPQQRHGGATAASAASARPRRPCLASSGTRQNMTQPSVSKYVYVSSCSSLG
jgi:hypothetical protein